MTKRYVVEKILQVVITEDDLLEDEELDEELALELSYEIDTYEWQEINRDVVKVEDNHD